MQQSVNRQSRKTAGTQLHTSKKQTKIQASKKKKLKPGPAYSKICPTYPFNTEQGMPHKLQRILFCKQHVNFLQ